MAESPSQVHALADVLQHPVFLADKADLVSSCQTPAADCPSACKAPCVSTSLLAISLITRDSVVTATFCRRIQCLRHSGHWRSWRCRNTGRWWPTCGPARPRQPTQHSCGSMLYRHALVCMWCKASQASPGHTHLDRSHEELTPLCKPIQPGPLPATRPLASLQHSRKLCLIVMPALLLLLPDKDLL